MATLTVYESSPVYLYCGTCGHVMNQQDSYDWGNTTEIYACPHPGCAQQNVNVIYPLRAVTVTVTA